jgi:D-aminoacyl-tRNA deacylase
VPPDVVDVPQHHPPAIAHRVRELYEHFIAQIRRLNLRCETGQFQATMSVSLINEGPVTILLDSTKAF